MDKTVVVALEWLQTHRLYRKASRRITKVYAHDDGNQCNRGDVVQIEETRPLSKLKRWRVLRVIEQRDIVVTGLSETGDLPFDTIVQNLPASTETEDQTPDNDSAEPEIAQPEDQTPDDDSAVPEIAQPEDQTPDNDSAEPEIAQPEDQTPDDDSAEPEIAEPKDEQASDDVVDQNKEPR
jgi:ribosomal protein uS17